MFPITKAICELLDPQQRDSKCNDLSYEDFDKMHPDDVARFCEWLTEKVDGYSSKIKLEAKDLEEEVCPCFLSYSRFLIYLPLKFWYSIHWWTPERNRVTHLPNWLHNEIEHWNRGWQGLKLSYSKLKLGFFGFVADHKNSYGRASPTKYWTETEFYSSAL